MGRYGMKGLLLFLITFNLVILQSCNIANQQTVEENTSQVEDFVTIKERVKKDSFYFSRSSLDIPESNTTKSLTLHRKSENYEETSIYLQVLGDCTYGEDWQNLKVNAVEQEALLENPARVYKIPFALGEKSVTLAFEVLNDDIYEGSESFLFILQPDESNSYDLINPSTTRFKLIESSSYPTVSLTVPDNITEGNSDSITISLSSKSSKEIKVPLILSGTASASDHDLSPEVVTIAAEESSIEIEVQAIQDTISEVAEELTITLGQPTNANLSDSVQDTIEIIEDDAAPVVNLSVSSPMFYEHETLTLTATLTGIIDHEVSIPIIFSGTATKNNDYSASSNSFTFAANVTNPTSTITITGIDDTIYEGHETITFTIAENSFITIGTGSRSSFLRENDLMPRLSFTTDAFVGQEGSTYRLPFTISPVSSLPITISLQRDNSSTATSADYSLDLTQDIIIPAGVSSFQKSFFIKNDNMHDANETLKLQIAGADNALIDNTKYFHTVTILDAGTIPKLTFTTSSSEVNENVGTVTITAKLDKPSSTDLSFTTYVEHISTNTTIDDINEDHEAQTITFNAGEVEKTFSIQIIDDSFYEPIQQFMVGISEHNGMALGDITTHTVSILDNEEKPEVIVFTQNQVETTEGSNLTDDLINFSVRLSHQSDFLSTLNVYTTEDTTIDESGYEFRGLENNTIKFQPGSIQVTTVINTFANEIYDLNKTLTINLSGNDNIVVPSDNTPLTYQINESNVKPEVGFEVSSLSISEGALTSIPIKLNRATYDDLEVTYTINFTSCSTSLCAKALDINFPSNYDSSNQQGTIIIPKGNTSGYISLEALSDNIFEPSVNESFSISISVSASDLASVSATNDITSIEVIDTSAQPTISFNPNLKEINITEGSSVVYIPIYLSSKAEENITFLVSARVAPESPYPADDDDFTLTQCFFNCVMSDGQSGDDDRTSYTDIQTVAVTIPQGQQVSYIPIDLDSDCSFWELNKNCNDALYEGNEIIELILENSIDSPSGTIYLANTNTSNSNVKANNIFTVTIKDDESFPKIRLCIEKPGIQCDIASSITEGDIQNTSLIFNNSNFNQLSISIYSLPKSQHESRNVKLSISGDAEFFNSTIGTSLNQHNLYDFRIEQNNQIIDSSEFEVEIPKNVLSKYLTLFVHKDNRFEPYREYINLNINSSENYSLDNQNSIQITVIDDDEAPKIGLVGAPPTDIYEYEYDKLKIDLLLLQEIATGIFITNSAATEFDFNFQYTLKGTYRDSNSYKLKFQTISFNSENNHQNSISISPNDFGDFRLFNKFQFIPEYGSQNATPEGELSINVKFKDLIVGTSKVETISGSEVLGHSCSVFRGLVSCWGDNFYGQLGRGNRDTFADNQSEDITSQASTLDLGTDLQFSIPLYATQVALSQNSTCVLFSNNKIKCFGRNNFGQLGQGISTGTFIGDSLSEMGNNLPYTDVGDIGIISKIHAMKNGFCTESEDYIKCWGQNSYGELGVESSEAIIGDSPSEMGENLSPIKLQVNHKKFATGANHACMLGVDNKLYCWGANHWGQLGLNHSNNMGKNTQDMDPFSIEVNIQHSRSINDISLGTYHSCVTFNNLLNNNTRCWGNNQYGQLGVSRVTQAGAQLHDLQPEIDVFEDASGFENFNTLISIGKTQNSTPGNDPLDYDGLYPNQPSDVLLQFNIPYSSPYEEQPSWFRYLGLNLNRNQFVGQYLYNGLTFSGSTYTCGYFFEYLDPTKADNTCESVSPGRCTQEIHLRCWGSNIIYNNNIISGSSIETGVLNNFGHNNNFDGCTYPRSSNGTNDAANTCADNHGKLLIPFVNSFQGTQDQFTSTNNLWRNRLSTIGDESHDQGGNDFIFGELDPGSYNFGFAKNFASIGSNVFVDFEMNYDYGRVKLHFGDYVSGNLDHLQVAAGGSHICVSPRGLNQVNNSVICWGANYSGQTGIDNSSNQNVIGGKNDTGLAAGGFWSGQGLVHDFNYSFPAP